MSGWDDELSTLLFRMSGRTVRFAVEVPQSLDYFTSKRSKEAQAQAAADKEHKRRWRSLLLIIKAKLEIVASGDSSFDREFLSDIMLPDGSTVGEWVVPQLKAVAWEGTMPKMLQGGTP